MEYYSVMHFVLWMEYHSIAVNGSKLIVMVIMYIQRFYD